jgi:hypothetical protein
MPLNSIIVSVIWVGNPARRNGRPRIGCPQGPKVINR